MLVGLNVQNQNKKCALLTVVIFVISTSISLYLICFYPFLSNNGDIHFLNKLYNTNKNNEQLDVKGYI